MKTKPNRTYIGGQAVIQGVMMRGKRSMVTVVRGENGELFTEARRINVSESQKKWMKIPFVRGVINFVSSLISGMQVLLRSSEAVLSEETEEEPGKISRWMQENWKVSAGDVLSFFSTLIGVVFAIVLFLFVPQLITDAIAKAAPAILEPYRIWANLIEGGMRLVIFILYILFTLIFKSLRETYMYHGAEHKTINCYEYGLPLTVENVRKCTRLHDRCGTTFLFIVLFISIVIFALVGVPLNMLYMSTGIGTEGILDNIISMLVKLLCLPIVAGISYEVLKLLSYTDSPLVLPLKAPGFLLQKLTTREPTDEMIECAILAFQGVEKMEADPSVPEKFFVTETKLSKISELLKKSFKDAGIDESDAEWIFSLSLGIPRSEQGEERVITRAECKQVLDVFDQRITGRPLWYIYGDADFYGYTFKVDERVLIPRPETELLVEQALKALSEGNSVLDLCTGSGAIAVALACEAAKKNINISVTASDISEEALTLARENAARNRANVEFVASDLFENINGTFNLITANPPYVKRAEIAELPKDVRDFEPNLALDGGEDGLDFYRAIAKDVEKHLVHGGILLLECGEDQAQAIIDIFRETTHCSYTMSAKDLSGVERFVRIGF